jgi:DNA polymerase elongation subunit (family B)
VAVFYALHVAGASTIQTGIISVSSPQINSRRLPGFEMDYANSELDLINKVVDTISELDPDIVTGWEIQKGSWGYLEARARFYGKVTYLMNPAMAHRRNEASTWSIRFLGPRTDIRPAPTKIGVSRRTQRSS